MLRTCSCRSGSEIILIRRVSACLAPGPPANMLPMGSTQLGGSKWRGFGPIRSVSSFFVRAFAAPKCLNHTQMSARPPNVHGPSAAPWNRGEDRYACLAAIWDPFWAWAMWAAHSVKHRSCRTGLRCDTSPVLTATRRPLRSTTSVGRFQPNVGGSRVDSPKSRPCSNTSRPVRQTPGWFPLGVP